MMSLLNFCCILQTLNRPHYNWLHRHYKGRIVLPTHLTLAVKLTVFLALKHQELNVTKISDISAGCPRFSSTRGCCNQLKIMLLYYAFFIVYLLINLFLLILTFFTHLCLYRRFVFLLCTTPRGMILIITLSPLMFCNSQLNLL